MARRTTISLSEDMHEWYKKEAEKIGVPFNALVVFAMLQYQKEQMVVPNIPGLMEAMQTIKGMNNSPR